MGDHSKIDDDKLIDDLSSALLSEKPEDHLNFVALGHGLGFQDLSSKASKREVKIQQPVSFSINELPPQKTETARPSVDFSLLGRRFASNVVDGLVIFSITGVLYALTLTIILGWSHQPWFEGASPYGLSTWLSPSYWGYLAFILGMVWFTYTLVFQSLTGSTLGKTLFGLSLKTSSGERLGMRHLLLGNAFVEGSEVS